MRFYEYLCPDCGARFELRREMEARDAPAQCPQCEGMRCSRRISLPLAFAQADGGAPMRMLGGSPCGGCVATSCAGCSSR